MELLASWAFFSSSLVSSYSVSALLARAQDANQRGRGVVRPLSLPLSTPVDKSDNAPAHGLRRNVAHVTQGQDLVRFEDEPRYLSQ